MSNRSFGDQVNVRYPLRRHRQRILVRRSSPHISTRSASAASAQQPANWGARLLTALAGWFSGVAADTLVMFAEHHYPLARNRDPDLFGLVLGTGFAGHTIYLIFGILAVTLLTAFDRQKWILWILIGFLGGLASV